MRSYPVLQVTIMVLIVLSTVVPIMFDSTRGKQQLQLENTDACNQDHGQGHQEALEIGKQEANSTPLQSPGIVTAEIPGVLERYGRKKPAARQENPPYGTEIMMLPAHQSRVRDVEFSPDMRQLVTVSNDYDIRLWNLTTGDFFSLTDRMDIKIGRGIPIAFSPDGTLLVTGSFDNTAKIWDPSTGELLDTLKVFKEAVRSLVFSPDGQSLFAGCFDNTIKVLSTANWDVTALSTIRGHTGDIVSIDLSPDGTVLASGSADHTVRLWNVFTTEQLERLPMEHDDIVVMVTFSPDGQLLASGSYDGTVRIWNTTTGEKIKTITAHRGARMV